MLRHYLIAAWRNLAANKLQSAIAIFGLAIGLTAAIIAEIVARDAFTRDHFIPGYDRIYTAVIGTHSATGDRYQGATSYDLAAYLRGFPEVAKVARISGGPGVLRHSAILAREDRVAWADPDFFRIYRAPLFYGDLDNALARPDGAVITLAMARKYFGQDNPVGQSLELEKEVAGKTQEIIVRAVIADWPFNASNYKSTIFASSLSPLSVMSQDIGTQGMSRNGGLKTDMTTLVQLAPGASLDSLNRRATALVAAFVPSSLPYSRSMHFERQDWLNVSAALHPETLVRLYVMFAITAVILLLSCVNFINLTVARSVGRGTEVALRKVAGADRRDLILQFLGESVLQVLLALVLAVALVEWLLPLVNNILSSGAVFNYWRDPLLLTLMLAAALAVGICAGAYPAFILSSFRPAIVLKGLMIGFSQRARIRQALVTLQFAALIVFLIAAATAFSQNRFATSEAMRVSTDQMLTIRMLPKCTDALKDRIAALPGVRGAACSSLRVLPESMSNDLATPPRGGEPVTLAMVPVDYGFFELYGIKADAGRLFQQDRGDTVPDQPTPDYMVHFIINEAAVRGLGYSSPQAAIGQPLNFVNKLSAVKPGDPPPAYALGGTIIGVVKDYSFTPELSAEMSETHRLPATAYSVEMSEANLPNPGSILHVKLSGQDIPEILSAIDNAWKKSGARDPIFRQFLDEYVHDRESTTRDEGRIFSLIAVVAMILACLGLFGVSLATAQRRIKEIGIRKAMGASDGDVIRLLLWQFVKPVLWASLIAWLLGFYLMNRWLSGFPYHIALGPWLFLGTAGLAIVIALLTVMTQTVLTARAVPATALRYE